ncbi:RNA polymerase sigma-70 factor, ECF subfamily [Pollutimonas bauzanensis]|uniref:RNA polymerase sigma-70 factor, ECF subfamily n=1 Tax=Pollutimonas bauzanensis TaxID=658167 RepID=A0A1M5ZM85_9BURK|nr:RNA polymerase sigma-70 factor, ECF subfamily [Pollutimonas bauzanensis]
MRTARREQALVRVAPFFVEHYEVLKYQLTYRLGSSDMASDALHETYIKLSGPDARPPVRSPKSFLLRMATNLAIDRIRSDSRLLSSGDIDELLMPQQVADPSNALDARKDLEALAHIMDQMPARRRQLLFAARVEGVPQRELASRYGISLRLV